MCDYELNSSAPFSPFQNEIDKVIHNLKWNFKKIMKYGKNIGKTKSLLNVASFNP